MARIERKVKEPMWKRFAKEYYKGIMNGISYIIPLIVAGGVLMGLLNLIYGYDFTHDLANVNVYLMYQLTGKIMSFMVPLFSAYIAYGMVGKPGLIPGLAGGIVMQGGAFGDVEVASAGFLGAMITGGLAAILVNMIKAIKVHPYLDSVKSIILIPLIGSTVIGLISLFAIAPVMGAINNGLFSFLQSLDGTSLFVVGAIMGIMAAADMGGPINKAAYLFAISMWAQGDFTYYAAFTLAKCIPGIIIGISVVVSKFMFKSLNVYSNEEQELSIAAIIMGFLGLTEGAIPYAAKDPLRIIPSVMIGCALGSGLVMQAGIEIGTGAGGSYLMLPLMSNPGLFMIYSIIAITVSVVILTFVKVRKVKNNG